MSRKSDVDLAARILERIQNGTHARDGLREALGAAYDLGRASQAAKDAPYVACFTQHMHLRQFAKCLRARVNRMLEGK